MGLKYKPGAESKIDVYVVSFLVEQLFSSPYAKPFSLGGNCNLKINSEKLTVITQIQKLQ